VLMSIEHPPLPERIVTRLQRRHDAAARLQAHARAKQARRAADAARAARAEEEEEEELRADAARAAAVARPEAWLVSTSIGDGDGPPIRTITRVPMASAPCDVCDGGGGGSHSSQPSPAVAQPSPAAVASACPTCLAGTDSASRPAGGVVSPAAPWDPNNRLTAETPSDSDSEGDHGQQWDHTQAQERGR